MTTPQSPHSVPDAYYEDSEGFLWRWCATNWRDQTPHHQWFPQAYTGPGPVPAPAMPVRMVYDEHGYSVRTSALTTDGGMYGTAQNDPHPSLDGES